MPYRANYPATVTEVIDERQTFNPAALRAVKEMRRARPWRMTPEQRLELFRETARKLSAAYGMQRELVISRGVIDCYRHDEHRIYLTSRMSVVTFLHEFAHARGFDERQACRWSINLFRRVFPRSFARCRQVGHMLLANLNAGRRS